MVGLLPVFTRQTPGLAEETLKYLLNPNRTTTKSFQGCSEDYVKLCESPWHRARFTAGGHVLTQRPRLACRFQG